MGRMDGEGLVHDEKKGSKPPSQKNEEKREEGKSKKERALKNLESRAIFTREIERSCAIFANVSPR